MNPIRFRNEHVDVRISAEAQEMAARVIDVDLRHVTTGVRLTPAERRYAEQTHAIKNMTHAHFDGELEVAKRENLRNGITGPRVEIGRHHVAAYIAKSFAYVRV
ncbi:hypothetical protein [Pararobbsia silviterrae]|uniref:Uncharacterized protein n=1 Tax=Pararobbsia silviterrae TaxID=1792498 RepID=A0A494Y302_9BURK|nr:hypothetical protein [Pararobbsia silviterrae]RKP56388.1 hypothetical protein D7S86_08305 [Pararobbsia silviterrae]